MLATDFVKKHQLVRVQAILSFIPESAEYFTGGENSHSFYRNIKDCNLKTYDKSYEIFDFNEGTWTTKACKAEFIESFVSIHEAQDVIASLERVNGYGGLEGAEKELNRKSIFRWITPEIQTLKLDIKRWNKVYNTDKHSKVS